MNNEVNNIYEKINQCKNSVRRWRYFSICLLVILTVLLSSIVTIVIYYEFVKSSFTLKEFKSTQRDVLNIESNEPSIFRDLTTTEMKNIMLYVQHHKNFNLNISNFNISKSFVFCADLFLPNKSQTLNYLEMNGAKPPREAMVVIFRGDKSEPLIEEYVLGPLPNIAYHRMITSKYYQRPAPFLFRPMSSIEKQEIIRLLKQLDRDLHTLLQESFEATFFDCDHCLVLDEWTPVSPSVSGEDKRQMWFGTYYQTSDHVLHPVEFFLLVSMPGNEWDKYVIEKIVYGGQQFTSAQQLLDAYMSETILRSRHFFPKENSFQLHTTHNSFLKNLLPTMLIEPNSKRYQINDRSVSYANWMFNFGMSTIRGPYLFNVRYKKRRLLYELSLQEIAIYQSGFQPWNRYSDILHSSNLIGKQAVSLYPGVDCPASATFIDINNLAENKITPIKRAFCIFEHTEDVPFRRHYRNKYFKGLTDSILIVRSAISAGKYEFIFDFIFHHDIIEVQVSTSGHMKSSFYTIQEARYGFQLHDDIVGTVSQICFNFKVDLDINGISNRYETLQIEPHSINNNDWSKEPGSRYEQLKITKHLKMTEAQTLHRQNYTGTVFHAFYNHLFKTTFKDPRAYKIQIEDHLSEVLPDYAGNEMSMTWARYKIAVTKRKDDEPHSSSIYSMWDAKEPLVQFQNTIDDNENIIDMDLVAWVTLGSHYLPQMEDLPSISTVGKKERFFIIPFNYFDESQAGTLQNSISLHEEDTERYIAKQKEFKSTCNNMS